MSAPLKTPGTLALACVLALGACSADDASSPEGAGTPSAPAAATTATSGVPAPSPQPGPELSAPALATSAADLAGRLVAAEDVVRDRSADDAARAQAAFETQVLYRQLARTPKWQRSVLAGAGHYRATVADHLTARSSLRSVLTTLSAELPAWRIVAPTPAGELMSSYREGQRRFGVPWQVLAAVNFVETGFGKIRGFSSAGARGPMQFMPATWAAYGEGDIDDAHDAIMGAARYLAHNGGGRPGGLDGALRAYNHHDGYVRGVRAYARILERDPQAFAGLHAWQIVYLSTRGDLWLPIGYRSRRPVPVGRYVRDHPERLLSTATS